MKKILILIFMLFIGFNFVNAEIIESETEINNVLTLDLNNDLTQYMIIFLIIVSILIIILFQNIAYFGGFIIFIIGLLLLINGFAIILSLMILFGGFSAMFIL